MSVEIVPRKHLDFSTYLDKGARAQSGACAEVQFPDYGTVLWSPSSRNISRKHCDFSTYLAKRARVQSGACAEVQFPDYETVL
jgi:methyl coenzyme M reductase subunit C